jgi:hypothetical protein
VLLQAPAGRKRIRAGFALLRTNAQSYVAGITTGSGIPR